MIFMILMGPISSLRSRIRREQVRSDHLKPGSIVIHAAQPRNVSVKVPQERKDVVVIESGVAEVKGLKVNCDFGLRKENEVYSCFAELLLLCWMKEYDEDHVDPISEEYVLKLWDISKRRELRSPILEILPDL